MSTPSLEEIERHLSALPPEAWDRPVPPPPPWPADPARPSRRRRLLVLRPLAAAGALLALFTAGLGAGLLVSRDDDRAPGAGGSSRVELRPVGVHGRGATGVVTLTGRAGGSAAVRLTGLRPSRAGDFYELWLLGADGRLVSLGSVRVPASGRAQLRVRLPVDPRRFLHFDISREPADGDPAHSTDSVLRGPTT
jgi:hypothetical protein